MVELKKDFFQNRELWEPDNSNAYSAVEMVLRGPCGAGRA